MKRPVEVQQLITAFSSLTKTEYDALDNTTWSNKSSADIPNVWSTMCSHLKLKNDDRNKKWLSHIWQTNAWTVADEVRKYVIGHNLKLKVMFYLTLYFPKEMRLILKMILMWLVLIQ